MATNKIEKFVQVSTIQILEDYSRNILKDYLHKFNSSETAKIASLLFSHCKSMEILSCHAKNDDK